MRIATYNTELSQSGPGLLLRDILRETKQVTNAVEVIVAHAPDVLILQSIDYDARSAAISALSNLISAQGLEFPYFYAPRPKTGVPTGFDIDGDGRTDAPRDAQGYGRYPGQAGLAILSRYPIAKSEVQDFTDVLWRDATVADLEALLPDGAADVQNLTSVAMTAVPIRLESRRLWILTHHATPPIFDGPEDRNGYRNADENRFWASNLEKGFIDEPYVLAALLNLDPLRGEGHRHVISETLNSRWFTDPMTNWSQEDIHTANFAPPGPGPLRVSYVLPAPTLTIIRTGLSPDLSGKTDHSRHRLVWVDIEFPF